MAAPPPVKRPPLRIPSPILGSGSHAPGSGTAAVPPKDGCPVRLRAGVLLSRVSLVRDAVCKTAVRGFDSPARL